MTRRTILLMAQLKAPRPQTMERGLGIAITMAAVATTGAAGMGAVPAMTNRAKEWSP
jgi:hypothetical protein